MQNKFIAGAFALGFGLSACNPPGALPVAVQDVITEAQSICGFLPTANSVAAILAALVPGVDTAVSVATAICDGVNAIPKVSMRGVGNRSAHVTLHGQTFTVTGRFAQ